MIYFVGQETIKHTVIVLTRKACIFSPSISYFPGRFLSMHASSIVIVVIPPQ